MNKQGKEVIAIPFLYLTYLVITLAILYTLFTFLDGRVTGNEFYNQYTAETIAFAYGLVEAAPGYANISYTEDKPYTLNIKGSGISVHREGSNIMGDAYAVKNNYLEHRDVGLFVNTTLHIEKKEGKILVE
ncbi:hypothetical protein HY500_00720 [Candidatus Woesearchaeota archaeon]|nr:hypothetical protein [Candidatus Woesearchaeota archaeon]